MFTRLTRQLLEQVKVISAKVQAGQAGFSREDIAFKLPGTPDAPSLVEVVELAAGKITWKSVAIKPDGSKDGAVEANFNQIENA